MSETRKDGIVKRSFPSTKGKEEEEEKKTSIHAIRFIIVCHTPSADHSNQPKFNSIYIKHKEILVYNLQQKRNKSIEYENKFQQLERNLKDTEKLISLDSEIGEMERERDLRSC